jgi:hypothetical protein
MSDLYTKILHTLLILRDTAEHFKIRSAHDIKKLIKTKLEAKTLKEPKDLGELYKLEKMISELRHEFEKVKSEQSLVEEV